MTEVTEVEGGLPEPEELEPAQGSLDLAAPEDRHTRADWEAATAAVLRKARRIGDDVPDSVVWDKLSRTTLDGIPVVPLGTPDLLDGLVTSGRPTRVGAWDIRAQHGAGDAKLVNEAALLDLDGGVTSLWVETDGTDLAARLDGVLLDLAPVVLDRPSTEQVEAFADHLEGVEPDPEAVSAAISRVVRRLVIEQADSKPRLPALLPSGEA